MDSGASRVLRRRWLLLADLQRDVSLLQLFIRLRLNLEQTLGLEMSLISKAMLCFTTDQISERKCEQQREQAGGSDDNKQTAHVRLELGLLPRQRLFLYLDE